MSTNKTNKIMLKRLYKLITGFFLGLLGKAEASNPEALLEIEKDNMRKSMAKFDESLAKHQGRVISAKTKSTKLTKQKADLTNKVKHMIKMSHTKMAEDFAANLQDIVEELLQLEEFLSMAESHYETLKADRDEAIEGARDKINAIANGIDQAKMHESMAEMNEMTQGFGDELSNSGLSRLEASVENRKNEAMGRSVVASDSLESSDPTRSKEYRDMEKQSALADFMAKEGIDAPAPAKAAPEPEVVSNTTSSVFGSGADIMGSGRSSGGGSSSYDSGGDSCDSGGCDSD
jgi:phage shock protein A